MQHKPFSSHQEGELTCAKTQNASHGFSRRVCWANVYGEWFIRNEVDSLLDSLKMILATSYMDSLTLEEIFVKVAIEGFTLLGPEQVNSIEVSDLHYFLDLNSGVSIPAWRVQFAVLDWILKLRQPVYFDDGGYAGNGDTVPAKFETIAQIVCSRDLFVPAMVRSLVIPDPR